MSNEGRNPARTKETCSGDFIIPVGTSKNCGMNLFQFYAYSEFAAY